MSDFRGWWLARFDDETLAAAASVVAGILLRPDHVEAVAARRRELAA